MTTFTGKPSELKQALKTIETTVDWIEAFIDNEKDNAPYAKIKAAFEKAGYQSLDSMDDMVRGKLIRDKDSSTNTMAEYIVAVALDYDLNGTPDTVYGTDENIVKRFITKYRTPPKAEEPAPELAQKGHGKGRVSKRWDHWRKYE